MLFSYSSTGFWLILNRLGRFYWIHQIQKWGLLSPSFLKPRKRCVFLWLVWMLLVIKTTIFYKLKFWEIVTTIPIHQYYKFEFGDIVTINRIYQYKLKFGETTIPYNNNSLIFVVTKFCVYELGEFNRVWVFIFYFLLKLLGVKVWNFWFWLNEC